MKRASSVVLVLGMTTVAYAPATGRPPVSHSADTAWVVRGAMSPSGRPFTRRVDLDTDVRGWEFTLEIADPLGLDLDLFVYDTNPEGNDTAEALCTSDGVGRREVCRLVPLPRGPIWVQVMALNGERRTDFVLRARVLRGVVLQGTDMLGDDARPFGDSASVHGAFRPEDNATPQVFGIRRGVREWHLTLTGSDPTVSFDLSVFDSAGGLISKTEGGAQQDLRVAGPGPSWYAVVELPNAVDTRRSPEYTLTLTGAGEPVPVTLLQGEFRAGGAEDRAYTLQLERGQTAVAVLEGRGTLIARERDSIVPVVNSFGAARQRVWFGKTVGSSRHLLQGATEPAQVSLRVRAEVDTQRYRRRSEWALRVLVSPLEHRYVVRLVPTAAEPSGAWWVQPVSVRRGTIESGGIAAIELPAPADVTGPGTSSRAPSSIRSSPRPQFLARLAEGADKFDVAVCTEDGQVLDIGESAVRWEWPAGSAALYLVVLPDPWAATPPEGEYRLEVTRSVIATAK